MPSPFKQKNLDMYMLIYRKLSKFFKIESFAVFMVFILWIFIEDRTLYFIILYFVH